MTKLFPDANPVGTALPNAQPSAELRQYLATRRSTPIKVFDPNGRGPTLAQVEEILEISMRVPDHRKLEPWRFIYFDDEAKIHFGELLESIYKRNTPNASAQDLITERTRLLRAPTTFALISSPDMTHKTPVWEQELSTGALGMNVLHAAQACGWAASWLTEWYAFDADVNALLGLAETERVAGYFFLGKSTTEPPERARPTASAKLTHWQKPR